MDVLASVEPINGRKPSETYEPMLKESVQRFLADYRNGVSDFSGFSSIFFRLVQTMTDPPLEITWFYSAVTFHTHNCTVQDPWKRFSVTKDLFQVLVSCSASCNGLKKVALLAPVIYMLYEIMTDRKCSQCKREIDCLVERIVSYISICCCNDLEEDDRSEQLGRCFEDLVRAWAVDKIEVNCKNGDDFRVFFPLVNDEVRHGVSEGCRVGYLAGVVMSEAFLLRLCLKFGSGVSRTELQKDMQNWVVNAITGFRNCYFFDTLLRMLLEPVLPVTSLLSSEDEVLLRNVLYDAVIMVEYSFLNPQKGIQLSGNHLKNLAVRWLFVADNAIRSVRENGDQTKAISYLNAFSESRLPFQLIKWVTNQSGMEEKTSRPNVSTPIALIKWLLIAEDQGIRVFDYDTPKLHAKAVIYKSRVEYELPVHKPDGNNLDDNLLFYSDNEGRVEDKVDEDHEMLDSVDTAFLAATHTMNLTATDGRRKRKEGGKDEGETRVKFVKVHLHENSVREKFLPFGNEDGLSSGSEVDNPVSDEDMEVKEQ